MDIHVCAKAFVVSAVERLEYTDVLTRTCGDLGMDSEGEIGVGGDHIIETLLLQDKAIRRVTVKIIKLAIAEAGESIGITMTRVRR